MRKLNGCSTLAPKSCAAKQWIKEELAQTNEEDSSDGDKQKVEKTQLYCRG